jgi:DNA-directed RNA polymerase specialized sigma24 family protein
MTARPLDLGHMERSGQLKRIVRSALGARAAAVGADLDDVQQDVSLRVLEAQRRPSAAYDEVRGTSPSSYVFLVAKTRGADALRAPTRQRAREVPLQDWDRGVAPDEGTEASAMDRVLRLLDLPEEKEMAMHLAAGLTLSEIQRVMRLGEGAASELRTRVRALLLPLRAELDPPEGVGAGRGRRRGG